MCDGLNWHIVGYFTIKRFVGWGKRDEEERKLRKPWETEDWKTKITMLQCCVVVCRFVYENRYHK